MNVAWRTASENNNLGYEIYRASETNPEFKIIASYLSDPSLAGLGTSSHGKSYSYRDDGSRVGTLYQYKLVDVSSEGVRTEHAAKEVRILANDEPIELNSFNLYRPTPNPAGNNVTVTFTLAEAGGVTLELFASDGRRVALPISNVNYGAGSHQETISVASLPAGTYLLKLSGTQQSRIQQLVVVR